MRLLLLAVLALAAVVLGATYEPHGGCDYDFGAGNGIAYLVVNNPYNLNLSLNITYQRGEHKYSEGLNVLNTRVIAFCGLGHGWLYIRQNASPPGTPLVTYPLAVPRYVVLRAGESATMSVTTLFAPAATIAIALLILVVATLRPRLRRSAIYAVLDELRDIDIREFILILLFIPFVLSTILLVVYVSPLLPESATTDIIGILLMYIISSLVGFYLSFHRGLFTYYFVLVGFLIDIFILINFSKSSLALLSFILFYYYILPGYFILRTLAVALLSFYNLSMVFLLSTYGIAVFIYYDMNFGRIIPWNLPFQIPTMLPEIIETIDIPFIVVFVIISVMVVFALVYGLTISLAIHAPAMMTYKLSWPPLWWWFGLGVFALDELSARSLLHRLSASGTVVAKLSRGETAFVVSADLYGMYLCRFGRQSGVCNNVELVRYDDELVKNDKLKAEAYRINTRGIDGDSVRRFLRKVALPIFASVSVFLTIQHGLIFAILIILSLVFYYMYYRKGYIDNDSRELEEYIQAIMRDRKLLPKTIIKTHILWSLSISSIFLAPILKDLIDSILNSNRAVSWDVLISHLAVFMYVFLIAIILSVLLRADPKLSRYLFLWLELRLMSVGGLVIGLARGGCLQGTKMWAAPRGSAWVIRDGDCLVVVSPYIDNVRSRLKRYLCGPACPPVRVVGVEGVAVGVLDLQKRRYYYYVVDSSR